MAAQQAPLAASKTFTVAAGVRDDREAAPLRRRRSYTAPHPAPPEVPVSAAAAYAERVDAVLAQRPRLRGPQPPGDLFAGVPPDHPLLVSDPRRPLDANLAVLASHVGPDDVVIDVGGGGGRFSLPLALRCRE